VNWSLVQLKEVCSFMTGGTPSTKDEANYINGNIPWIVSGDIHLGEIFDASKRITNKGMNESPAKFLPENSVLIALNGQGRTRATVALLRMSGATCNQSIVSINPLSPTTLDYRYLFVTLRSMYQKLRDLTGHANRTGLNMGLIGKVKILLPPLEEQKKIAAILDAADELRQKDKALIAKYDELTQSLFLDMFGDPVTNPKGWKIKEFSYFATFDTQMTKDFSKYASLPHIGIANIQKDSGKLHGFKLVKDENLVSGKYIFTPDHIIYSKIRPNLNKVALPSFSGLCSADSYPILPNMKNTNRVFLAFLLRSESFVDFILTHSSRTNIPKANKKQMGLYRGIAPPVSLQDTFSELALAIDTQKALAQESHNKSEELFNSLLQKAFKGELTN